ncbi:unnamed protein product, partial [Amoebophrya sp. A25]|eukprot:GSA25T00010529001.1
MSNSDFGDALSPEAVSATSLSSSEDVPSTRRPFSGQLQHHEHEGNVASHAVVRELLSPVLGSSGGTSSGGSSSSSSDVREQSSAFWRPSPGIGGSSGVIEQESSARILMSGERLCSLLFLSGLCRTYPECVQAIRLLLRDRFLIDAESTVGSMRQPFGRRGPVSQLPENQERRDFVRQLIRNDYNACFAGEESTAVPSASDDEDEGFFVTSLHLGGQ